MCGGADLFDRFKLICGNWDGVSIKEILVIAFNLIIDSIIFDGVNAGEIAVVFTLKQQERLIEMELYHLLLSVEGEDPSSINIYDVCGRTPQNSITKSARKILCLIMQSRLSKKKVTDEILTTECFIKERSGIELRVICNE